MSFTQRSRWGGGAQEGRGSESIRFQKNGLKDSRATLRSGRLTVFFLARLASEENLKG